MTSNTTPHYEGNSLRNFSMGENGEVKIPAKYLNIVWGRDSRYWGIPEDEKSPVELYQVCWLEVTGCVDQISPDKNYEVIFNVSLTPDAFGWAGSSIYLMAKRGKNGRFAWTKIALDTKQSEFRIVSKKDAQESNDGKLYFGLYEVWSGKWKGGLKIFTTTVRETS